MVFIAARLKIISHHHQVAVACIINSCLYKIPVIIKIGRFYHLIPEELHVIHIEGNSSENSLAIEEKEQKLGSVF